MEKLLDNQIEVDDVAKELFEYFAKFDPQPEIQFHVAGYKKLNGTNDQQVWYVSIKPKSITKKNPPGQQGASWGGEADILMRLIQPVATIDDKGNITKQLPYYPVPFRYFTLQDAIDFCIFAVRSTIDAIRFQPRSKSVGGPIDVLVIKPDESKWIRRKELHA